MARTQRIAVRRRPRKNGLCLPGLERRKEAAQLGKRRLLGLGELRASLFRKELGNLRMAGAEQVVQYNRIERLRALFAAKETRVDHIVQ